MKKACCFYLLFLLFSTIVKAQEQFRVMFYNVENLFDCKHDSLKQDEEYLPQSIRHWHYGRLKKKIYHLNKVIVAVGQWEAPTIIGLSEVENQKVLQLLVNYSPLKQLGYRYVMTESPDLRGIDVAFLWQRRQFRYLAHQSLHVPMKKVGHRPTRDLLHVVGRIISGDTLDVYVCHFPSRYGGQKRSEPARLLAARTLRHNIDSVMNCRLHPQIIVMGDFNDYPTDASLMKELHARHPLSSIIKKDLYNLMLPKVGKEGSHNYHGEWGILDQFIVSGSLLQQLSLFHTSIEKVHIAHFPFLLRDDMRYGGKTTFRTYYGMRYLGGYSDHLPIWCDFSFIHGDKGAH